MKNFRHHSILALALLLCAFLSLSCLGTAQAATKPTLSDFVMEESGSILYPDDTLHLSVKVTSRASIKKVYARITGPETVDVSMSYSGGSYVGSYTFDENDVNGEYSVRYIIAVDVNGGKATLANPSGSVVLDGASEDEQSPVLKSFKLKENGQKLLPGETANFVVSAKSGSKAELSEVRVNLNGPEKLTVFLTYSEKTGLWTGSYTFTSANLNGDYYVESVFLKDGYGHGALFSGLTGSVEFFAQLVQSITLSRSAYTLVIDTATAKPGVKLKATVLPGTAANRNVIWYSSDKTVAKVNSSGYVEAVAVGECKIYCKAADTSKVKAVCKITVTNKLVERITLNKDSWTGTILSTYKHPKLTLKATVTPATAMNQKLTWSSSDETVAKVSSKGVVTCQNPGVAYITATAKDGSGVCATCKIKVKRKLGTEISLDQTGIILLRTTEDRNPSQRLVATILPEDAVKTTICWRSENEKVAKADGSLIVAVAKGSTYVYCYLKDAPEVTARCKVTVKDQCLTSIKLNKTWRGLTITKENPNPTYTLVATCKPTNAISTDLVWSSSDENVATVSENGVVTAVGAGTCVIRCKAASGSAAAKCNITVYEE